MRIVWFDSDAWLLKQLYAQANLLVALLEDKKARIIGLRSEMHASMLLTTVAQPPCCAERRALAATGFVDLLVGVSHVLPMFHLPASRNCARCFYYVSIRAHGGGHIRCFPAAEFGENITLRATAAKHVRVWSNLAHGW